MSRTRPIFDIQIVDDKVVLVQCDGYESEYFEPQIIDGCIILRNCIPKRRCCNKTPDWLRRRRRQRPSTNANADAQNIFHSTPQSSTHQRSINAIRHVSNCNKENEATTSSLNQNLRSGEESIGGNRQSHNNVTNRFAIVNKPRKKKTNKAQVDGNTSTSPPEAPRQALRELSLASNNAIEQRPFLDKLNTSTDTNSNNISATRTYKRRAPTSTTDNSSGGLQDAVQLQDNSSYFTLNNNLAAPKKFPPVKQYYNRRHKPSRNEATSKPTPSNAIHTPNSEDFTTSRVQNDENNDNTKRKSSMTPVYIIPAKIAYVRRMPRKDASSTSIPLMFDFVSNDNFAARKTSTPFTENSMSFSTQNAFEVSMSDNNIITPPSSVRRNSATPVRPQVAVARVIPTVNHNHRTQPSEDVDDFETLSYSPI